MAIWVTKNEMKKCIRGCKQPPNAEETHDNQLKDSVGDGGRCYD
jgi:hypothetical protein